MGKWVWLHGMLLARDGGQEAAKGDMTRHGGWKRHEPNGSKDPKQAKDMQLRAGCSQADGRLDQPLPAAVQTECQQGQKVLLP